MFTARQIINSHKNNFQAYRFIATDLNKITEDISKCIDTILEQGSVQELHKRSKLESILNLKRDRMIKKFLDSIYEMVKGDKRAKDLILKASQELAQDYNQQVQHTPSDSNNLLNQGSTSSRESNPEFKELVPINQTGDVNSKLETHQQSCDHSVAGGGAGDKKATQGQFQEQPDTPRSGTFPLNRKAESVSKLKRSPQRLSSQQDKDARSQPGQGRDGQEQLPCHDNGDRSNPSGDVSDKVQAESTEIQAGAHSGHQSTNGLDAKSTNEASPQHSDADQGTGIRRDNTEQIYKEIKNMIGEFCEKSGISPATFYDKVNKILNESSLPSSSELDRLDSKQDPFWNIIKKYTFDSIAYDEKRAQKHDSSISYELISSCVGKFEKSINHIEECSRYSGGLGRGYMPGNDVTVITPKYKERAEIKKFLDGLFNNMPVGGRNGSVISSRRAYPRISAFGRAANIPLPDRTYTFPFAVVIVDTSASVSSDSIQSIAIPIIYSIISKRYKEICLVNFDTKLQHIKMVKRSNIDQSVSTWYGRGGTDMGAALSYVTKQFILNKTNVKNYQDVVSDNNFEISKKNSEVVRRVKSINLILSSVYVITDCDTGGPDGWKFPESEAFYKCQLLKGYPSLVIFNFKNIENWPLSLIHYQVKMADPKNMTVSLHNPATLTQAHRR